MASFFSYQEQAAALAQYLAAVVAVEPQELEVESLKLKLFHVLLVCVHLCNGCIGTCACVCVCVCACVCAVCVCVCVCACVCAVCVCVCVCVSVVYGKAAVFAYCT